MIALSTAYKQALIAVDINGRVGYKSLEANCKHSENLLLSLDELLEQLNVKLEENDFYSIIVGPGSFTGLRITTALVKGLEAGSNQNNILTLTTFDLMAYSYIKNFAPKEDFACIINALSGKYFICKYSASGQSLSNEQMITTEEYNTLTCKKVALVEEGCGDDLVSPSAEELLALAKEKFDKEKLISSQKLTPLYIRKSQAEETKK